MRRKFIILLLGIIVISSISSILSPIVESINEKPDYVLLDTVSGSVGAGNFTYWHLGHFGPLVIELTSLTGDADLYIADNIKPTYEIDGNNFSSATCGIDVVHVPASFPRPLGIAVFGHWSHAVSDYSIQVVTQGGVSEAQVEAWRSYEPHDIVESKNKDRPEEDAPRFRVVLDFLLDKILDRFAFI